MFIASHSLQLLPKNTQDRTIRLTNWTARDLLSTFEAANLMTTWNQYAIHGFFAA
jgi:hypothetical protein